MQRLIRSHGSPGHIAFDEAEIPVPSTHEALIRVKAVSLNRGELGMAADPASAGQPIGWDFAGVVEQPAADRSTPDAGTRVVGWRPQMDAWAEHVVSPAAYIAAIPDSVSDEAAATLPVAGLTALAALDKGTRLVGNAVLVTGATGGVGHFAVQLSKIAGARVVAQVRKRDQVDTMRALGADEVVVSTDGHGLGQAGSYRLVIDGVGGDFFPHLVPLVAKGGTLVSYGVTGGSEGFLKLHPDLFGGGGQRSIYGLTLYTETELESSSIGLSRLLALLERGSLKTTIARTGDWSMAAELATALMNREVTGKVVATIEST